MLLKTTTLLLGTVLVAADDSCLAGGSYYAELCGPPPPPGTNLCPLPWLPGSTLPYFAATYTKHREVEGWRAESVVDRMKSIRVRSESEAEDLRYIQNAWLERAELGLDEEDWNAPLVRQMCRIDRCARSRERDAQGTEAQTQDLAYHAARGLYEFCMQGEAPPPLSPPPSPPRLPSASPPPPSQGLARLRDALQGDDSTRYIAIAALALAALALAINVGLCIFRVANKKAFAHLVSGMPIVSPMKTEVAMGVVPPSV